MKLKNIFLAATAVAFLGAQASHASIAFGPEGNKFMLAADLGISLGKVYGDGVPDGSGIEGIAGFTGGITGSYHFSPYIGVFAGLNYTERGYSVDGSGIEGRVTADYIDIPVGITFNYSGIAAVKSYTNIGALVAIPMGDFEGQDDVTGKAKSSVGFGLHLDSYAAFPVAENIHVGPKVWMDWVFTNINGEDSPNDEDVNDVDFGIGLAVSIDFPAS